MRTTVITDSYFRGLGSQGAFAVVSTREDLDVDLAGAGWTLDHAGVVRVPEDALGEVNSRLLYNC